MGNHHLYSGTLLLSGKCNLQPPINQSDEDGKHLDSLPFRVRLLFLYSPNPSSVADSAGRTFRLHSISDGFKCVEVAHVFLGFFFLTLQQLIRDMAVTYKRLKAWVSLPLHCFFFFFWQSIYLFSLFGSWQDASRPCTLSGLFQS